MSTIDIVFIVIFAAAAIVGFSKGAVRQIGSIAGAVAGFIAARLWGDAAGVALFINRSAEAAADRTPVSEPMAHVMGCAVVFLVAFIAVFVVARLLRQMISLIGLGMLDRLAGALLSAVKWFVAVSAVLNLYVMLFPSSGLLSGSTLAGGAVGRWVMGLFPWLMGVTGVN